MKSVLKADDVERVTLKIHVLQFIETLRYITEQRGLTRHGGREGGGALAARTAQV